MIPGGVQVRQCGLYLQPKTQFSSHIDTYHEPKREGEGTHFHYFNNKIDNNITYQNKKYIILTKKNIKKKNYMIIWIATKYEFPRF